MPRHHHRRLRLGVRARRCAAGPSSSCTATPTGGRPGAKRLDDLGLPYTVFSAPGTSEDVAMLLAYQEGAELMVAVGTHNSMVEFLDKGRAGMASTFLVRMKVGGKLVDAKGVSRLYRSSVRTSDLLWMILAAVFTLAVALMLSEPVRLVLRAFWRSLLSGLMINFRFHIVSLTAVLLALGIGLVLGTTFLDDALEEALKDQLSGLEASLDRARVRNDDLQGQLDPYQRRGRRAAGPAGRAPVPGPARGRPGAGGVDPGRRRGAGRGRDAVAVQADADLVGVWWLTDRLALDDDAEVEDLSTGPGDRYRRRRAPRAEPGPPAGRRACSGRPTGPDEAPGAEQPAPAEPRCCPGCARAASSSTSCPRAWRATWSGCRRRACGSWSSTGRGPRSRRRRCCSRC